MSGSNLRILARNLLDGRSGLSALPALLTTLPETNLVQDTERARTARTSSLAAQDVTAYWTSNQTMNMSAFTRTNFSTAATVRNLLYPTGSPSTAQLDTGNVAAFSTSGLNTDIDVYTEADFRMLRNTVQYFASQSGIRQLTSRWTDAANADGYIEATRWFVGKYFQTTYDPPFGGLEMQFMDPSKGSRASDGTLIVDKQYKARQITLRLDFIPDADLPTMLAIARYLGQDKECWLDVYPDDATAKGMYHRGAFKLVDSPTFNPWQVGLHKNTMTFQET